MSSVTRSSPSHPHRRPPCLVSHPFYSALTCPSASPSFLLSVVVPLVSSSSLFLVFTQLIISQTPLCLSPFSLFVNSSLVLSVAHPCATRHRNRPRRSLLLEETCRRDLTSCPTVLSLCRQILCDPLGQEGQGSRSNSQTVCAVVLSEAAHSESGSVGLFFDFLT